MRVLLIAFVALGGLVVGYLVLLLGPHAFEPPMRYALAQDVTLTIAGRAYTAHEEVNCSAKDQRGSIASASYSIDDDGQPPIIDLPGNGLVLISGLKPCRWVEAMPATTPLVLSPGSGISMQQALRGMALVFDDVRSPKRVMAYPLAELSGAKGSIVLRKASLTGIKTASPRSYDVDTALPFLAAMRATGNARWSEMHNAAFLLNATIVRTLCESKAKAGEGWISPVPGDCSTGGYDLHKKWVPLQIDTRYSRVDLFPDDKSRPGNGVVIFGAAAAEMRSASKWTVKVCIKTKCFDMSVGGHQDGLVLVDREHNLRIDVNSAKWFPPAFEE